MDMCMYCKNSTTVNSTTTHVVNYKNCIIVIKNVPCLECEQCGEKVVSVHSLKSANTVIEILREYRTQRSNKYIFHWFTGTIPQLEKAIELGCYFSINPSMLKTKSGLEIINTVPVERMLLETDAPFTFKVQHIEEIEKELNRAALKISDIVKSDMMDIFCENAKEVFRY